jgi:hypothetical protein
MSVIFRGSGYIADSTNKYNEELTSGGLTPIA